MNEQYVLNDVCNMVSDPSADTENYEKTCRRIRSEIDSKEQKRIELLPVEVSAKETLDGEIEQLKNELRAAQTREIIQKKAKDWKTLSPEAFSLENEKGQPALGIFPVFSEGYRIALNDQGLSIADGEKLTLPTRVHEMLGSTFKKWQRSRSRLYAKIEDFWESDRRRVVRLYLGAAIIGLQVIPILYGAIVHSPIMVTCGFFFMMFIGFVGGSIMEMLARKTPDRLQEILSVPVALRGGIDFSCLPNTARKSIKEAGDVFGKSNVFLVAPVLEWDVVRPTVDPLVVGNDGSKLWLVDRFDTVPVEEYIAEEFTTNPNV